MENPTSTGRCFVLNYYADLNVDSVVSSFEKLNFKVELQHNLNYQQTIEAFKKESNYGMHHCKCFILCVFAQCENGGFHCRDKFMPLEKMISHFHDVHFHSAMMFPNSGRIPKFFFINHRPDLVSTFDAVETLVEPFYYFVRKCHLYIWYSTYPVSWLLRTLCKLHNLYGNETMNESKLLTEMLSNIENYKLQKFRLKPKEYLSLECFDQFQFRHLLMQCCTNSIGYNLESHQSTQANNLTYEVNVSPENGHKIGRCLILNYKAMYASLRELQISHNDLELMESLFSVDFDVEVHNDLTVRATEQILIEESQFDHSSLSCLIVYIMAEFQDRGLQNRTDRAIFYCRNGETFDIGQLIQHFSDQNCPSLSGKPKIIFQLHWNSEVDNLNYQLYAYRLGTDDTTYLNLHNFQMPKDFLFFVSPKFEITNQEKVSFMIRMFQQVFKAHSSKYDLLSMLHMLLMGVHFNTEHFYIDQMKNFYIKSTLTKLFFLKPQNQLRSNILASTFPKPNNVHIFGHPSKKVQKCLILDYCHQELTAIGLVESAFSEINFVVDRSHTNLTSTQTMDLLECESNLSKYDGIYNEKIEYTCLVICIFAKCSKDGFECSSGKVSLHQIASRFYILFLLLWYDKRNVNQNDFHCFLSQTSNIFCSLNTYPDSWFMAWLCAKIMQSLNCQSDAKALIYTPNRVIDMISANAIEEGDIQQDSNRLDEIDSSYNSVNVRFIQNILKLSSNTFTKSARTEPFVFDDEQPDDGEYILTYSLPSNCITCTARCIILTFNKLASSFVSFEDIDQDVTALENTFCGLGFEVDSYCNLTCKQVTDFLIGESNNNLVISCFVLCLITKCENGYFQCSDNRVALSSLINLLESAFANIPKIMIIQDPFQNKLKSFDKSDAINCLLPDQIIYLPEHFLLIHSTFYHGFMPKLRRNGSWFVQTFCKVVAQHFVKYDLMTMLRMVLLSCIKLNFEKLNIGQLSNEFYLPNVYIQCTLKRLIVFDSFDSNACTNGVIVNRVYRETNEPVNFNCVKLLTRKDSLFYNKGKGRCLVVNCCDLDANKSINSIQSDVDILKNAFERMNFKFDAKIARDQDSMNNILRNESRRDCQEFSCLVVFILVDANYLDDTNRNQLVKCFVGNRGLVGKPKLFFLLGNKPSIHKSNNLGASRDLAFQNEGSFRIPKFADFLFFASDQVSNTIKVLVAILSENAPQFDLLTLLSRKELYHCNESLPYFNSTLTRLVLFEHNSEIVDDGHFRLSYETRQISLHNRGRCLLFNYEYFDSNIHPALSKRDGTQMDVESLHKLFDHLKFPSQQVRTHHNLSVSQVKEELRKESLFDYSDFGCAVICFLSHGNDLGVLHCTDGDINKDELVDCLTANETLRYKPKLIFIQACQGTAVDPGILVAEITAEPFDLPVYDYPDLFVFSSSYPGYYSYRDSNGSWFIQTLCRVLSKNNDQYDLVTIATITSRLVGLENQDKPRQIPFFHSTLTQPVIFANFDGHLNQAQ